MSQRGQQSVAHEFDPKTRQCKHCGMAESNVRLLSHDCTSAREALMDSKIPLAEVAHG
jgi:hypothetical protein